MPLGRFQGDHPTITGDRQVPQLPASKAEAAPLQTARWFRNGKHPDAFATSQLCEAFNQWAMFRTKEIFGQGTILGKAGGIPSYALPVASAAGTVQRYRFAFHTSPFHNMALCRAVMYPQTTGYNNNSYATISIYSDVTESTLVATETFYYGNNPLQTKDITGWQYLKFIDKQLTGLSPDTDYYALVSDVDYGQIQSLSVAELNSLTNSNGGYLPQNWTAESIITDEARANLVESIPSLWKRGGAKILNWTVDAQAVPRSTTSATPTNLIDSSSTTYGASIPGFEFNMTGKARLAQSLGVPCVMKVFGRNNGATALGRFYLKDATGVTVAVITDGWGIGTPAWQSVAFNLPATSAKYYLVFDDNSSAGAFQVYAVSIYQYET